MKLKGYVVFDSKTEAYMLPHFFRSRGEAIRAYTQSCNDENSNLCKFPGDYTFFEICEFDDSNGSIVMYEHKVNLGTALELKTV